MESSLLVKDFGPIKDVEMIVRKVTILIGPQGSGKSTLAKLVAICKEDERPLLSSKERPISFRVVDYGLQSYINKNTRFTYHSPVASITYRGIYKNSVTALGGKIALDVYAISERLKMMDSVGETLTGETLLATYGKYQKILSENGITEPIYIPTERFLISTISSSLFGLMSNNINLPKTLTEFGNKYKKASTNDSFEDIRLVQKNSDDTVMPKTKHIELFDLHFQHRDGQDFLISGDQSYEVNLKESASGMQSSIPLLLVVRHEYKDGNKLFIIEEPELNLFPTTQKQLLAYLIDKGTQNGNELILTTHSPYVLSVLNNLLFAYKVAKEMPEKADEIDEIIPKEQWLNPDDVVAYYVGEGTVRSIMDESIGLIADNELDTISEDIAGERDELFTILRSKKREVIN